MNAELLEKVKQLSPEQQKVAEEFVDYLLQKYPTEILSREEVAEKRRQNMGRLKGQIWMADDFNETPEDFKDYI